MISNEFIIKKILDKEPNEEDISYSEAWNMIQLTKKEILSEINKYIKSEGVYEDIHSKKIIDRLKQIKEFVKE